jgi:hypothetical protein
MMQLAFDLAESRKRRDNGLARVASKNSEYMESALQLLRVMGRTRATVTGEAIRAHVLAQLKREPTSPNVWGALTNRAVHLGILRDTGRVERMIATRSHARRTPVWAFIK